MSDVWVCYMNVLTPACTYIGFRLIHSFTCAGILQTQYMKLSLFAGMGSVKNDYIQQGTYMYLYCIYCSEVTYTHM